jgi:asparagine synthetase B (glutamine-hydrolysing)
MFFSAYLGSPAQEPQWRENLGRHAAWLGLSAHAFSRGVANGRVFAFGWASLRPPDTDALVREDGDNLTVIPLDTLTRAEALAQGRPRGFTTNAIRMDVSLSSGEVRIEVPILTPEQFYWASGGGDWVFGNDLRLMLRWAGLELDDMAVYGLLQYGFIPPPLTISRTVHRISPGHRFVLQPLSPAASVEQSFDPGALRYTDRDTRDADELLREALDWVLSHAPLPAVMHFSGGVDSGLMAARLVAMGRRGILSVFPYLEPTVVRAAFSLTWNQKYEGRVLKVPLKRLLARSVPREWVYRSKGVFNFPFRATFTHPDARAFWADVVLSPQNPLLDYLIADKVRMVFHRAETGRPLHVGARKFLWGVTFGSAWLNGLETSLVGH